MFPPGFPNGQPDNVFVTKLNAAGSDLVFSTYLGGSAIETAGGVATDAEGNSYVTGSTTSTDFPTTSGAFQPTFPPSPGQGVSRAFVTKLTPVGTLAYSTYIGSSGSDNGYDIAVDGVGRAYVVGATNSLDFPLVDPVQAMGNGQQAFALVLDASGSTLLFSSHLGGSNGYAIGVGAGPIGTASVVGVTINNLPTVNAFQPVFGGAVDLFVAKIALSNLPRIDWTVPSAILYGSPLGTGQQNASADMAGTFDYDPPAGTVLHAGIGQTLSVTFTPSDARFATVPASVSIDVGPALLTATANSATKVFGAPLPAFSAGYSGFVNGDTVSDLAGTLTLSTTGTPASPAGTYNITPGGLSSADYDITFAPGTLTIVPAATAAVLVALRHRRASCNPWC
jgi:hypothetical protein